MYSNSTLRRKSDNKLFKVTMLSHWSDIQAEDGEKDCVKYFWGGLSDDQPVEMISHKGQSYFVLPKESTP